MARVVDFADGAQSETTPTIGNIVASSIVQYPDDATYEATEQGAPAEGNLYFNTTIDQIRYYNGAEWITLIDASTAQTLTNKTIDADSNTITNLENDNIKAGAAIDATKIHDGSVDNTEFSYLDGVTSNIQTQLNGKQDISEKGQPLGYASLDNNGQVPAAQLPSFVDDVLEYADFASFPVTGETGKIYIALDTNLTYRWSGSVYVQISSGVDQLSDLTDANTAGVADRDQLIYNQGAGEWQPSRASLGELSDTDLTTTPPVNGDALVYDGADWVPGQISGGTGEGGINYITNSQFEDGTVTGWNLYDDGAVAEPIDGTGGSPAGFGRSIESVDVLRGNFSLQLAKSVLNRQGQGASTDFTIDPADKNSTLSVTFDYYPQNNQYVTGDMRIFVYDIDNLALIGPVENGDSGNVVFHDQDSAKFTGFFETTNSLNYRLIFHTATTNTLGWDVFIDNVKVGPQEFLATTYEKQEIIDCTGSGDFTGGQLLVSRTGNIVSIRDLAAVTYASSSSPSSAAGLIPDWARPTDGVANLFTFESAQVLSVVIDPDGSLNFSTRDWAGVVSNRTNSSGFSLSYPVEHSSNIVSNLELQHQTSIAKVTNGVSQVVPTAVLTTYEFNSEVISKGSAFEINTASNQIIVKKAGYIRADFQSGFGNIAEAATCIIQILQNGIAQGRSSFVANNTGSGDPIGNCSTVLKVEVGDVLTAQVFHDHGVDRATLAGLDDNHFTVEYIPDFTTYGVISGGGGATTIDELTDVDTTTTPPNIGDVLEWDGSNWVPAAASVSVARQASVKDPGSLSMANAAYTTVTFQVTDSDPDAIYNSGTGDFTVIESGIYAISGILYFNANASGFRTGRVLVNGSPQLYAQTSLAAPSPFATGVLFSGHVTVNASDTITIQGYQNSGAALSLSGSSDLSKMTVHKIS